MKERRVAETGNEAKAPMIQLQSLHRRMQVKRADIKYQINWLFSLQTFLTTGDFATNFAIRLEWPLLHSIITLETSHIGLDGKFRASCCFSHGLFSFLRWPSRGRVVKKEKNCRLHGESQEKRNKLAERKGVGVNVARGIHK